MSTASTSYWLSDRHGSENRGEAIGSVPEENRLIHCYTGTFERPASFEYRPTRTSSKKEPSRSRQNQRTKRRLQGFLIEFQDDNARVGLIVDGEVVNYDLPANRIRQAGVKVRNQPFQMDEIEMEEEDGSIIVGYRITALANPGDAYIETLNFDDERKRKRDLILKEFSQAKG